LIDSDSFGFMSEISDFDGDLIKLIDLDIFEDDFRGDDFEGLLGRLLIDFS
jgi:hypothetical protein